MGPSLRAAVILAAAWALLFFPQLFLGRMFVLGDAADYRPFADLSRERWTQHHERTFWNPYVFMGIPGAQSLADSRPQYLPDLVLDVYERVRPAKAVPLAGPLAAHLLGMLAAAALARRLWNAGAGGQVCAGLAWGIAPALLIPFTFGHDAQFVSSSLIPVVALTVQAAIESAMPRAAGWALALSLAAGIQVLCGHPQIIVYGGMLAIALAFEEAFRLGRRQRLALVGGALVLGAGLAAAVWWPALLYSRNSIRGGGGAGLSISEVARFSLGPIDLLSLAWPRAAGFGGATYWGGMSRTDFSPYLGIAALVLAVAGLRRRGAGRGPAVFWFVVVLAAATLSVGGHLGATYAWLHVHVPFWSRFRVPSQTLVMAQLGVALLAARAFSGGDAAGEPTRRAGRWRPAAVVAAQLLVAGAGLATGPLSGFYRARAIASRPAMPAETADRAAREAGRDLLLRLAIALGAVAAVTRSRRSGRFAGAAPWAAAIVIAADLGSVAMPFLLGGSGPYARIAAPPPPPLARVASREPWARALATKSTITDPSYGAQYDETYTNFWISWRARSLAGTHGSPPAIWRPVMTNRLTGLHPVLRAFGVVYFATDSGAVVDTALYTRISAVGEPKVYRLRGALGRAYTVPLVLALADDEAVIRAMKTPGFPPEQVALATDPAAAGNFPEAAGCRIRWIEDEPDRIAIETDGPGPAFLVVADAWFPGWRAELDGAPARIVRVDQMLRGVRLPAGLHRLRMTYEPEGWWAAAVVTRVAFCVWLALIALLMMGPTPSFPPAASRAPPAAGSRRAARTG